ncbi:unnamed protein product [Owenia fusiformis]|uniref:Uncharacterized protein n=1 Tax=Owenia fusiformis TaxID=6347 RepID=A0A8J1USE9_OWEFU|nr:unnamed protein product [Owenia fusiformis]
MASVLTENLRQTPKESDYLTCGTCWTDFPLSEITTFIQHKKIECDDDESTENINPGGLLCQTCPQKFLTAWSLVKHVQGKHNVPIYKQSDLDKNPTPKNATSKSSKATNPTPTAVPKTLGRTSTEDNLQNADRRLVIALSPDMGVTPGNALPISRDQLIPVGVNILSNKQVLKVPIATAHSSVPGVLGGTLLTSIAQSGQLQGTYVGPIKPIQSSTSQSTLVQQQVMSQPSQIITKVIQTKSNVTEGPIETSGTPTQEQPMEDTNIEKSNQNSTIQDVKLVKLEEQGEKDENMEETCCDNVDCGITVMPGTHENLKECCNAVVPKKRKRHMEMKHLQNRFKNRKKGFLKSSRPFQKQLSNSRKESTIYIDFQPAKMTDGSQGDDDEKSHDDENTRSTQGSIIIQPGGIFSLPMSHNSMPSVSFSHSSEKGGTAMVPISISTGDANVGSAENSTPSSPSNDRMNSGMVEMVDDKGMRRRYPTSRPYKCDKCDHSFNQRIHLKKHQSKHTGVKPYKCQQCDYSTVERSHLKVHIRIHTGEKPFKCTYCEYATTQNCTLKIHLRRHHNESGGYLCITCGQKFPEESTLQSHSKEHSPGKSAPPSPAPMATSSDVTIKEHDAVTKGQDTTTAEPVATTTDPTIATSQSVAIATGPSNATLVETPSMASIDTGNQKKVGSKKE